LHVITGSGIVGFVNLLTGYQPTNSVLCVYFLRFDRVLCIVNCTDIVKRVNSILTSNLGPHIKHKTTWCDFVILDVNKPHRNSRSNRLSIYGPCCF